MWLLLNVLLCYRVVDYQILCDYMYFTLYFQGTWGSLTLKNRQFQPRSLNVGTLHASHVLHAKHCFAWNGAVDIAES